MIALTIRRKPHAAPFLDRQHADPSPMPGEVLVRVDLAGICATDLELARGYMAFDGVLGHEFVGTVMSGSTALDGRRVVCEINCVCGHCDLCAAGLSSHCRDRTVIGILGRDGCFAEFISVPQCNCHILPDSIPNDSAVFVEPLAAAYQILRQESIQPSARVAVLGTGRLGLLIAQVLAAHGCPVEAIGRNELTLAYCAARGIRATRVQELDLSARFEYVIECTGSPEGLETALQIVRPRGTIILKSTYAQPKPTNLAPIVINEIRLVGSRCGPFPDAIAALAEKRIDVAGMISHILPLASAQEALAAAADPRNIKILLRP